MRIRQVKPDFFRDGRLSDMPDSTRLIYIGLWMEADDAGWLRYDITEIAADLYPYHDRTAREAMLTSAINALARCDRLQVPGCGHAFIPTLVRHQRFASDTKRVFSVQKEHESLCVADTRDDPRRPATVPDEPRPTATDRDESRVGAGSRSGKERVGTERNGSGGALRGPTSMSMTKKKPDDEERIDYLLAKWPTVQDLPDTRRRVAEELGSLGIHDIEAELARRVAA